MHAIAVVIALMQPAATYEPDFLALFTTLEYAYTGGNYQNEVFRYRLFVPDTAGPGDKKPLVVWLNGLGEAGDDNLQQLRWLSQLIFRPPWKRERYPFFLLAIQSPRDNPGWIGGNGKDEMLNVVSAIVDETIRQYAIDADRVYLAGISSGGSACWEYGMRRPELFAALAPMASQGGDNSRIGELRNVPVWAFHSSRDPEPPVDYVRKTVNALREAGGQVQLTEIDSAVHDCWNAAFSEYFLLDWLLTQRRGRTSWWDSARVFARRSTVTNFAKSWQWWQILLQVGIPAVLLLVVWKTARRRARIARARSVVA